MCLCLSAKEWIRTDMYVSGETLTGLAMNNGERGLFSFSNTLPSAVFTMDIQFKYLSCKAREKVVFQAFNP